MFTMLSRFMIILSLFSFNAGASVDNPFAKNDRINIGKDVSWKIDRKTVLATKTSGDNKGVYYHLGYDNKQIKLALSTDKNGLKPKKFNQLEIKNVKLDGKQVAIFNWCLNNQQRHNRFLQQGLSVKNNVCLINSGDSSFVMRLNKDTLKLLQQAKRLSIVLKPFRKPVELNYDISDFSDMSLALNSQVNTQSDKAAKKIISTSSENKKCWAGPPTEYKSIKSVQYDCSDKVAKKDAETWVAKLVVAERVKRQNANQALLANKRILEKNALERKRILALEKEKKRKLDEANKKKRLAEKLENDKKTQAEALAIAASKANQLKINNEITKKMINVCGKFWNKGEHRCYCQKYIEHAPSQIQENSSCN